MQRSISGIPIEEQFKRKAFGLIIALGALLAILLFGLINMQIFNASYYEELSRNNRLRFMHVKAPRGRILDRTHKVLADNRASYNIMVIPEDIKDIANIARRIAPLLDKEPTEIEDKIKGALSSPYEPVYIAKDITFEQLARIEIESINLPGITIDAESEREYLTGDLFAHTLGVVGEISEKELKRKQDKGYRLGDLIGKSGVESACEDILRGKKGELVFEVNALGRKVRVIDERPSIKGDDVVTTLDSRLQKIALDALSGRAGAVVTMVPDTGEILTLVSSPTFDPSIFIKPMSQKTWDSINKNPLHPLENRALRGLYAPGSIYKIVVSLAGLMEGSITPSSEITCTGSLKVGSRRFWCWKRSGHGDVDLIHALGESCDVFFYTIGRTLGIKNLALYSDKLGLGRKTGVELNDASGIIPTPAWKKKRFKRDTIWHPGETINTSIGQGYLLLTPIQIAKAMSAVVNGGKVMCPKVLKDTPPYMEKDLKISKMHLDHIKDGLRYVVEDKSGTAHDLYTPEYTLAGKTGTAQVARVMISRLPDEADIPYRLRDHAWFFGFSPIEKPEIVVVVVVEHGGHGGSIAAPIAGEIIQGYYAIKKGDESHEYIIEDH